MIRNAGGNNYNFDFWPGPQQFELLFLVCTTNIIIIISGAHGNNHNHHNPCERPTGRFVLIMWTASPQVRKMPNIRFNKI